MANQKNVTSEDRGDFWVVVVAKERRVRREKGRPTDRIWFRLFFFFPNVFAGSWDTDDPAGSPGGTSQTEFTEYHAAGRGDPCKLTHTVRAAKGESTLARCCRSRLDSLWEGKRCDRQTSCLILKSNKCGPTFRFHPSSVSSFGERQLLFLHTPHARGHEHKTLEPC